MNFSVDNMLVQNMLRFKMDRGAEWMCVCCHGYRRLHTRDGSNVLSKAFLLLTVNCSKITAPWILHCFLIIRKPAPPTHSSPIVFSSFLQFQLHCRGVDIFTLFHRSAMKVKLLNHKHSVSQSWSEIQGAHADNRLYFTSCASSG